MNDRSFELLTKLYNKVENIDKKVDTIEKRVGTIEKIVTNIENDHGHKLEAVFDGYNQVYYKQQEHDKSFDKLDHKIDDLSMRMNSQESKFEVLEGGKKKTL